MQTRHAALKVVVSGSWVLLSVAAGGCRGGQAHVARVSPAYAQSVMVECKPNDSSVGCCVKKHPGNPEACGLTASEAREFLTSFKGAVPQEEPEENEEEGTPEWKQGCIDLFVACQDNRWLGNCYDCMRYCEGQLGKWPYEKCKRRN